jgi:rod shape-determining protein MreC
LLGLALLSMVMMLADSRFDYLSTVRFYASYLVTPLHWLADTPRSISDSVNNNMQSRSYLIGQNQGLKEQLLQQQYQVQKLGHLEAENRRLNELLNASSIVEERTINAELTGESPDPFTKRVLINKGSVEGVYVGQPVLDAFGLMGQVVEVEPYASWVLLITDPQHFTPIQINRNGNRAIASGTRDSLQRLELNNISDTFDVMVDDVLVTSGFGGRFPVGYPVGVVSSVVHDPGAPCATVTVEPSAQLDRSRNVLLVFK